MTNTPGPLLPPPEPYEQAMLNELRAMTWRGPITPDKIQRRLRVGFAKAGRLALLYQDADHGLNASTKEPR